MKLDQLTNNSQTETQSPVQACRRSIGLPEVLEDMRQKFRANALTRVFYANLQVFVSALHPYFNVSTGGRELNGVRKQI